MIRLGLRLALRSGREGLVRLVITTVAVGIGVAMLLGVLAEFHAFQVQSSQPCWSCTQGESPVPSRLPARGDLWNNSVDFYQGQTITRLDVAALGSSEPVPPGISALPAPGTYYASPALAALLKTVPADQLGDRFPGHLAGTIGNAALSGPGQLVAYVGYPPPALAPVPGTEVVDSIATAPAPEIFTSFFRYAFGVGVLAVLFPILVLIGTRDPAGGRPPGGALRRASANRRHSRRRPGHRRGGVGAQRAVRYRAWNRGLPAGAAIARGRGADRAVLPRLGDAYLVGIRRDPGRRAGDRLGRRPGLAAPGGGVAARRGPPGHPEAARGLAAHPAARPVWGCTCADWSSPRTRASARPSTSASS